MSNNIKSHPENTIEGKTSKETGTEAIVNDLKALAKAYNAVPVPEELSQIVDAALDRSTEYGKTIESEKNGLKKAAVSGGNLSENVPVTQKRKKTGKADLYMIKRKRTIKRTAAAAAALVILTGGFAVGVNTSETFAQSMSQVPVLSGLVKIFTGFQAEEKDDVAEIHVELPKVDGLKDEAFQERINREIYDKLMTGVEESRAYAAENRAQWLSQGNSEEDYMIFEITVDYEVKSITDDHLSFVVRSTETAASAYFKEYYYNIDLQEEREIILKDLLGEDFKEIANAQIAEEIQIRSQNPDNIYWDEDEAFQSVSDDQAFYLDEAGKLIIVFNKYEIAPGFMGIQEFRITPL